MPDRVSVLGVPFDAITQEKVLLAFERAIERHQSLFCVTPNPEMCLLAMNNQHFLEILRSADLSIPDGIGILWASGRAGKKLPARVSGVDVVSEFIKRFPHRKVFLLGASTMVNEKLARKLKQEGANVVGNFSGDDSEKLAPIIIRMINASAADVLFVAFGAPKQEQWIARHRRHLKTVCVAMGVGGSFDFLSGEKKRSPLWMRKLGLEWVFRLLIEPSRIRRIFRATVVFPWKVYFDKKI